MPISRRQFLAASAFTPLTRAFAAPRKLPNIVWFMLDDAGYGDLGPFGQNKIKTPTADRLAKEGMKFTDCYAGGSVCAPSRCTLMTGLHSGHAVVRGNVGTVPLPADQTTVATLLKKAGYTTGLFGKWGLGDAGSIGAPEKHGFDEALGYLHQIHAHSYYPEFLWHDGKRQPLPGNANGQHGQYSADVIAQGMQDFVRKHKDKPFFLYAVPTLPHAAYEPPDTKPYEQEDWPKEEKQFASMVTRGDAELGRILDLLREFNLENDTIVFYTSDNGAPNGGSHRADFFRSNGPFRGVKGQLYEGGLRVPMIVRWPGKIAPGSQSAYPWSFWDFLPTACEIAGQPSPKQTDGRSVLPVLQGKQQAPDKYLYWEQYTLNKERTDINTGSLANAVRFGDWKAIRLRLNQPVQLYNLRDDIGETKDVASAHPDIVKRAEDYLKEAHAEPRSHSTGNFHWVGQPAGTTNSEEKN